MPTDHAHVSQRALQRLLLLILAAILAATALTIRHNWQQEESRLHSQTAIWSAELSQDFEDSIAQETQALRQTLQAIVFQPALPQALAHKDVARLKAEWMPLFARLRADSPVSHFYFLDANRNVLLRLHAPDHAGDRVERWTAHEAQRTGQVAAGMEVGLTGVPALRVVQPVTFKGQVVGFVELGAEIQHILQKLHSTDAHQVLVAALLHKEGVDRGQWEAGMRMLGHSPDWQAFERHVATFLSPGLAPQIVGPLLAQMNANATHVDTTLSDQHDWHVNYLPLLDARGKDLGALLLLHDITAQQAGIAHRARMMVATVLVIAALAVLLFTWLLRYFSRQIGAQYARLQESETRFHTLFDLSPEPVWIIDGDHFVDCNQASVRLLGYPDKAALLHRHPSELSPPFQPDGESSLTKAQRMMQISRENGVHRFEWVHSRRDNSTVAVEVTLSHLVLEGRPVLHCVWRDVSQRKQAEEQLRSLTHDLQEAQRLAKIGNWELHHPDNTMRWSDEVFRILEIEPPHVQAHLDVFFRAVHLQDRDAVREAFTRSSQTREPSSIRHRLQMPDGRIKHVREQYETRFDAQGKALRSIGTIQDITEHELLRQELVAHRDRLETLVAERTADLADAWTKYQRLVNDIGEEFLAFSLAPDGLITYASNSAESVFGVPREKLTGEKWHRIIQWVPQDLAEGQALIQRALNAEIEAFQWEARYVHGSGSMRTIYANIHLVRDSAGAPLAFDGVLHDITQRKQTELDLMTAKSAAETATQAKSAFLANMSHEIRTPMNGVIGMLEVLAHGNLSADERSMVTTIRHSADTLLCIINDILDFSKIEAGRLGLSLEEASIETIFNEVCTLLDRIAMEKQVDLSLFFDSHVPQTVLTDPLRLRQILTNLVGNALKFSAGLNRIGQVRFRVEMEGCDAQRAWVHFVIADNGIGMDAPTTERLFKPFVQADSATTRHYGGTGLGLSISRNLVEMMGGNITVRSELDQGSTFTVRLPFAMVSGCPNAIPLQDLHGLECLLVADDARYIHDYTHYLTHAGARVRTFASLAQARMHLAQDTPADPICMIVMEDPALNSTQEIVERLRREQPHGDVRFVNITYLSIERGKRRKVRKLADDVVQIDREALTRQRFLQAVAVASGRGTLDEEPVQATDQLATPAMHPQRLLVAEDNAINREVIQRQLSLIGYSADMVNDGAEAYQKWNGGHYDLVLTDLHMPHMDGYELTEAIRKTERERGRPRTPIVAITANALKGEEERCLHLGMDAYLTKPIEMLRLKQVLTHWFAATPLPPAVAAPSPTTPAQLAPPVSPMNVLPVFDASTLSRMVGDQPAIHRRLLTKFLASAQERTQATLAACAQGDVQTVAHEAHALKSAARSVGVLQLGELCAALEQAGKAGDATQCHALCEGLGSALEAATSAIVRSLEAT